MATFNNTTSNSATLQRFQFFVRVFRHAGIPIFFNKIPKLFVVYDIACNFCTWMTTTAILIDIIMNTGNLETYMETIRLVGPITMITGIYTFARWRVNAVTRLLDLTESFTSKDIGKTDHDSVSSTMVRWIPRIKIAVRNSITIAFFFVSIYTFIRILKKSTNPFIYNAWYPYDITVSPAFEMTLITQVIGFCVYINTFYGFGGLYVTIVTMVCMELEDIRANILNIGQITCRSMEMSSSVKTNLNKEPSYNMEAEFGTQEAVFRLRQKHLSECVRRHQNVLSYIQIMERTLNPIMAEILLLLLISLCLFSFSMITSWGNGNEIIFCLVGYLVTATSAACYCWFGSQISDEAEQVRDAAYGCDWIGAPISLQRSVAMIITITNNEVALTAGKFVPINVKTMMNMISQSLSYFMFLLEVKDKFNEPGYVDNS